MTMGIKFYVAMVTLSLAHVHWVKMSFLPTSVAVQLTSCWDTGLKDIHWTESEWVYLSRPSGGSLVQMITTLSAPPEAKLSPE